MATNDFIEKDLGIVTAYGEAVAGGYRGTREEFQELLANVGNSGNAKQPLTRFAERTAQITGNSVVHVEINVPEIEGYKAIGVIGFGMNYGDISMLDSVNINSVKIAGLNNDKVSMYVVNNGGTNLGDVNFGANVLYVGVQ